MAILIYGASNEAFFFFPFLQFTANEENNERTSLWFSYIILGLFLNEVK